MDQHISNDRLQGLRVLVVEDETLISMLLEEMLADLGCQTVGPFESLASARDAAENDDFDIALLDFTLRGENAAPVAEALSRRNCPFAIASGGGDEVAGHGEAALVKKPFQLDEVTSVLRMLAGLRPAG